MAQSSVNFLDTQKGEIPIFVISGLNWFMFIVFLRNSSFTRRVGFMIDSSRSRAKSWLPCDGYNIFFYRCKKKCPLLRYLARVPTVSTIANSFLELVVQYYYIIAVGENTLPTSLTLLGFMVSIGHVLTSLTQFSSVIIPDRHRRGSWGFPGDSA